MFIIIGLLLAAVAFGLVIFISSLGGGGGALGGPSTPVVIARQAIPLRHQIKPEDIEIAHISVNGNASLANTYTSVNDITGKGLISEINITKGTVLTSDMLATDFNVIGSGAAPAYLPLAKGYVAMTIPTGEQVGVAGHISVGDYITVIASAQVTIFATTGQQQGPARVVSKTVFTNLRVIGLGPATAAVQPANGGSSTTTNATGAQTGVTSSLTVELTQCDAEFLTWFLNNTQVRYTLESYKDYATAPVDNGDAKCKTIADAHGVSNKVVDDFFQFSKL
ncbi:MAG TPA: RcpC/CpaB family pilus assembly protein [Candidatus Dormibacteraeota bacterium]|nr:RcpC/CpaB family pilus assembly protein [Candidatus Dormibacteraeota bacterium]